MRRLREHQLDFLLLRCDRALEIAVDLMNAKLLNRLVQLLADLQRWNLQLVSDVLRRQTEERHSINLVFPERRRERSQAFAFEPCEHIVNRPVGRRDRSAHLHSRTMVSSAALALCA